MVTPSKLQWHTHNHQALHTTQPWKSLHFLRQNTVLTGLHKVFKRIEYTTGVSHTDELLRNGITVQVLDNEPIWMHVPYRNSNSKSSCFTVTLNLNNQHYKQSLPLFAIWLDRIHYNQCENKSIPKFNWAHKLQLSMQLAIFVVPGVNDDGLVNPYTNYFRPKSQGTL